MTEYVSVSYDGEADITAEATDKFGEPERETRAAGCEGNHRTQSGCIFLLQLTAMCDCVGVLYDTCWSLEHLSGAATKEIST